MREFKRPIVHSILAETQIPKMFLVKQIFERPVIKPEDIPSVVFEQLNQEKFASRVKPGMSICITASSRGIANAKIITKAIADWVKTRGADPFVIPAMGSHGGATDEGQRQVLAGYGITEEYLGCPVVSSMETVWVGKTEEEGRDVYIDKHAYESDGIILNGRIKPHTAFRGPYESGMMKMMAIGLGKQYGAEACHEQGFKNMHKSVPEFGKCIIKNAPILFGIPSIENAFDETCKIVAVAAEDIEKEEPELLKYAFSRMARIMVPECDALIVDEIGKNFSGDGMDPNITGNFPSPWMKGGIKSQRIGTLNLTDVSHGNALAFGTTHATTQRIVNKLDLAPMYANSITCTVLEGARIPLILENDEDLIKCCIQTCIEIDKKNPRVVRIPNSLHIEHIMLSEAYYDEVKDNPEIEILTEPAYLEFDENGDLLKIGEEAFRV